MKKMFILTILVILSALFLSCGKSEDKAAGGKLQITVSILPQKYFIERIGGDRVSVQVLAGEGQNPHSYDPTPKQMAAFANTSAWILSGTDFEIALKPKVVSQYPSLVIVDGTSGVRFRKMEEHSHEDDDHHAEKHDDKKHGSAEHHDDHEKGNIDRHTWLGHNPSKIMAGHIRDLLVKTDPAGKDFYESNYQAFLKDVESVFGNLKKTLKPLSGKTVLVFHPAFGYFLDEFGIEQEAVETGGKEPNAKALSSLIKEAKADKTPAIFVQSQFPVNAAKTVADAVGAEVVMLDPLSPDWLENIKKMGAALESSLIKKR
jgi:zinc transport system substrate-binding protein